MSNSAILAVKLDTAFPGSVNTNLPPYECLVSLLELLDTDSRIQINKFRRLPDAQRCCIGRLLPRYVLTSQFGIKWNSIQFNKTVAGRPYAIHSSLPTNFDFNISHDSNWIVIAWTTHQSTIGIDVMKVAIPWNDTTLTDFIEGLNESLTEYEQFNLQSLSSEQARIAHIFGLWTLKEAYSKAIGLGLGVDFKRFEFNFDLDLIDKQKFISIVCYVEGKKLEGWNFELQWIDEEHLVAIAHENSNNNQLNVASEITFLTLEEIVVVADKVTD